MKTKAFFGGVAMIAALSSCTDNESFEQPITANKQTPTNNIRSYEEALQIARSSLTLLDNSETTRSSHSRKIDLNDSKVLTCSATRSTSGENDTLLYVFNFEDEEGFAVVSASTNTEGLLAITESGRYDPESLTEISGFNFFIDMAQTYVKNNRKSVPPVFPRPMYYTKDVREYESKSAGPYLPVAWGQYSPANTFCPNSICGCGPLAIAQVMAYYKFPTSIALTYPNKDKSSQYLDWDIIISHGEHSIYFCNTDTATHYAIGRLCRQLGHLSNSTYSSGGTSTYPSGAKACLETLGYHVNYMGNYAPNDMHDELDNKHLLIMGGADNTYTNRHSWVLDGYTYEKEVIYHYRREECTDPWKLHSTETSITDLYHINWGWSGKFNGFYNYNVFDTAEIVIPDDIFNDTYRPKYPIVLDLMSVYL